MTGAMPMPSTVRPIPNPAPRAMPLQRTRFWLVCLLFLCWALLIAFRLFRSERSDADAVHRSPHPQPRAARHASPAHALLAGVPALSLLGSPDCLSPLLASGGAPPGVHGTRREAAAAHLRGGSAPKNTKNIK